MAKRTPKSKPQALTITAHGKTYRLAPPSINTAIKVEELLSTPQRPRTWGQVIAGLFELDARCVVAIVYAALQQHHADEITTLEAAAAVIDGAGGIFALSERLQGLSEGSAATSVIRG